MEDNKFKISVIMSVFNNEEFLNDSIESILNQSYKNFEFIIINDASFDKSPEILKYWADKDRRIKLATNGKNIGLTKSLNKAIKIAQGKYIARQDGDDISLPQRLEKQVEFLEKHPEIKILGTFGYIIDKHGEILGKEILVTSPHEIKSNLIKRNPFIHTSVMIRKEIIDRVGGYNERFKTSQDYELWFRILRNGVGENIPSFLVKKRYHTKMISIGKDNEQLADMISIQKQAIRGGDFSRFCYIYLLKNYFSLACPVGFKMFLRKYLLRKRNIFKRVYGN